MEAQEPFDPARVRFLRSWGAVLYSTGPMDLPEQLHGCMVARTNSNVNMRKWKAG